MKRKIILSLVLLGCLSGTASARQRMPTSELIHEMCMEFPIACWLFGVNDDY